MRRRLAAALLLAGLAGCAGEARAANYRALIIRSVEPLDYVLVEEFEVNDKKKLYRLAREGPLRKSEYQHLPKISFRDIYYFRIESDHLRVVSNSRAELTALPENFKKWPKGRPVETAAIVRGSRLEGKPVDGGPKLRGPLPEGWIVYLFSKRPGPEAVAFALAEAQGTEEAWAEFLEQYPQSWQAQTARENLGGTYLERARAALERFEEALAEKKPGYAKLPEARRWLEELRALTVELEGAEATAGRVSELEAEIAARLQEARRLAENAEFDQARARLEPWAHFREELPALEEELSAIRLLAARHHVNEARRLLGANRFDEAEGELEVAASYEPLPEIGAMREEIGARRVAYQQEREIEQARGAAQGALDRGDLGGAFEALWPVALRFPSDQELQAEFVSLAQRYRVFLLGEVADVERLHTPIRGLADEEALLRVQGHLKRLAQVEAAAELEVWRDRLGQHLAAYYQQRAGEVSERHGEQGRALAFAYLQQARRYSLGPGEQEGLSGRRRELEHELTVRVAMNFRDLTPAASGEYLVAELSALMAAAIQNSGLPHVEIVEARRPEASPTLELVVELLQTNVVDESEEEPVTSEYSAGYRQVPNPEWRQARTSYDQGVAAYEQLRRRIEEKKRNDGDYKKKEREADEKALAAAGAALAEARAALDGVPAFIETEDVRSYEFRRRQRTRTATLRLSYRWVNARTGVREEQDILEERVTAESEEVSGVHPGDRQGHRNQPAGLPEAATLRGRALRGMQGKLGERVVAYLESFTGRDFERARQQAAQGNREQAAEHYLRFLFNCHPEDPRREPALDYLQREFHLTEL